MLNTTSATVSARLTEELPQMSAAVLFAAWHKTIPSLLTAKYTGNLALLRPKSRGKQKQMKH
jgi:hypothetical protein